MEAMRDKWTDERLDDMNRQVGEISRRMDEGFSRLDAKIDSRHDRLDAKIDALRSEMGVEFRSLNRLIVGFGGTLFAAILFDILAGRL